MTMITKPRHFKVQELVPPTVYLDRGEKSIQLMDTRLLLLIDELRDYYGPAVINDWLWDGSFTESGLRTPDCTYYSPYSQHTLGRAVDLKFKNVEAKKIRIAKHTR